jgi:hypothetical protein
MREDRRTRAEARRQRAILRKTTVAREHESDPSPVRGPDAVSLVHRLTLESWSLSGRELPAYSRAHLPIRFVRGRPT